MRQPFVVFVNALWAAWARTSLAAVGGAMLQRVPSPRIHRGVDRCLEAMSRWAWWQPALRARLAAGRDRPLVPEAELEATYRDALALVTPDDADEVGAYLEFGVYVGTSLLCMHRASVAAGFPRMRLIGFDSFEGLPPSAGSDDGGAFRRGWYRAGHGLVREHLTRSGIDWSRTTLVPGWFDETLHPRLAERLGIDRVAVILIDCDIYSSARAALRFCAPMIRDRAVVVFDDWNAGGLAANGMGERRAFEELLAEHPDLGARPLPAPHDDAAVFLVTRDRAVRRERG
ncbi:MAG TPA: TylF/MycF/NovP-related O-methyltransferase [Actinomycetota bacterium]|nr:TylF/MycF/NovP-related O-methyltransferase [Actinomycetota bacterium]